MPATTRCKSIHTAIEPRSPLGLTLEAVMYNSKAYKSSRQEEVVYSKRIDFAGTITATKRTNASYTHSELWSTTVDLLMSRGDHGFDIAATCQQEDRLDEVSCYSTFTLCLDEDNEYHGPLNLTDDEASFFKEQFDDLLLEEESSFIEEEVIQEDLSESSPSSFLKEEFDDNSLGEESYYIEEVLVQEDLSESSRTEKKADDDASFSEEEFDDISFGEEESYYIEEVLKSAPMFSHCCAVANGTKIVSPSAVKMELLRPSKESGKRFSWPSSRFPGILGHQNRKGIDTNYPKGRT